MNQKGASAIIVTSLVIVVIVALSTTVFTWSKNYSKEQMNITSGELKQASDFSCLDASFKVTSCTINSETKAVNLVFMNNSNLKIFNLVLTIHANETIVSGSFDKVIDSGEIAALSTGTNFTYIKGETEHSDMDTGTITDITLTNGTCPKKVLDLSGCTIVNTLLPPTADPVAGPYTRAQDITLSTTTAGATIYYTLDGSTPTTDSNVYSTPITIPEDANTTLKAIAAKEGYVTSDVNTWVYSITHKLSTPTADPIAGTYYGAAVDVTLSAEEGATIYYTTDGTDPTIDSNVYSVAINIPIDTSMEILAIAVRDGYGDSDIFSAEYQVFLTEPCSIIPENGEIYFLEHLDYIDTNADTRDANYTLIRDLNFLDDNSYCQPETYKATWTDGNGWDPIGASGTSFTGSFDGNNHKISNLYINRPATDNIGLFGLTNTSLEIKNLGLEDVNVIGQNHVGGFMGALQYGTTSNSYSTGSISGTSYVGGLVGTNYSTGTISNSYSTSSVSGTSYVGGLIGRVIGSITNSYSTGTVTGTSNIGGLLAGCSGCGVTNSYWDMNTSGKTTSAGGTGKTTTQMKTQSTFTDWNFDTIWAIDSEGGISYPYLQSNEQTPHPGLESFDPLTVSIYSPTDQNNWIYPPVPYTYNSYKDFNATISGGSGEYTCSWNLKRYDSCFSLLEDLGVVSTDCNFNRQLTHACNFYYFELTVSSLGVQDKIDGIAFAVGSSGGPGCPPCPVR